MRTWQLAAVAGALLASAGCRTDPAIVLLERDNRLKEDEIYRLRERVQDLEEAFQAGEPAASSCPRPAAPTRTLVEPGPQLNPATGQTPALAPQTPIRPGPSTSNGRYAPPPEAAPLKLPTIEMPDQPLPKGQVPERLRIPQRPVSPKALPGGTTSTDTGPFPSRWNRPYGAQVGGPLVQLADSAMVAQITLNQSLTGGIRGEGRTADEGILVVVEPRDVTGRILHAPGDVSLALLDPEESGEAARFARWDFTAQETAEMLRSGPDEGIHLSVLWSSSPPPHSRIRLLVRYTTRDGRKLQVEREITVALAGDRSAGAGPLRERPILDAAPEAAESWRRTTGGRGGPQDAEPPPDAPPREAADSPPRGTEPARLTPHRADPSTRRPTWSPERRL